MRDIYKALDIGDRTLRRYVADAKLRRRAKGETGDRLTFAEVGALCRWIAGSNARAETKERARALAVTCVK